MRVVSADRQSVKGRPPAVLSVHTLKVFYVPQYSLSCSVLHGIILHDPAWSSTRAVRKKSKRKCVTRRTLYRIDMLFPKGPIRLLLYIFMECGGARDTQGRMWRRGSRHLCIICWARGPQLGFVHTRLVLPADRPAKNSRSPGHLAQGLTLKIHTCTACRLGILITGVLGRSRCADPALFPSPPHYSYWKYVRGCE